MLKQEYLPLNGYQSQQGSEIFFTWREGEEAESLSVVWPSGRESKLVGGKGGVALAGRILVEEP